MRPDWVTVRRGVVCLRSELMPLKIARSILPAFEQMPGVAGAEVVESRGQGFLIWQPSDEQERDNLYVSLMVKQAAKAREEMDRYDFTDIPGGECVVVGLPDPKTQIPGVYIVGADLSCDCPDYLYRCLAAGLLCKHGIAVNLRRKAAQDESRDALVGTEGRDFVPGRLVDIVSGTVASVPMTREQMAHAAAADFG